MPTKCYVHMSAEEYKTLSLAHGHSLRTMASVLGRVPSPMTRESTRNASRDRPYRACPAHTLPVARAGQPRRPRKLLNLWLWQYDGTHLVQGCSPEQIAGHLRRVYPDGRGTQLSAETIYAGLYVLSRARCGAHCVRRAGPRQARAAEQNFDL